MSRWKIESVDCGDYRRWFVSEQQPWGWEHREAFPLFEEAIDYADRLARTVQVELPAGPNKNAQYMGYEASSDYSIHHHFGVSGGEWSNVISLEESQIEPFALGLLAHARKG